MSQRHTLLEVRTFYDPKVTSLHPSIHRATLGKVQVKYTPKEKLRRRYWPKYAWAFGWFTHGKIGAKAVHEKPI